MRDENWNAGDVWVDPDDAPPTSHPVKAEDVTIAYPDTGKQAGLAVVHKTGCRHAARDSNYGESLHRGKGWTPAADDYFYVSPCAR